MVQNTRPRLLEMDVAQEVFVEAQRDPARYINISTPCSPGRLRRRFIEQLSVDCGHLGLDSPMNSGKIALLDPAPFH